MSQGQDILNKSARLSLCVSDRYRHVKVSHYFDLATCVDRVVCAGSSTPHVPGVSVCPNFEGSLLYRSRLYTYKAENIESL